MSRKSTHTTVSKDNKIKFLKQHKKGKNIQWKKQNTNFNSQEIKRPQNSNKNESNIRRAYNEAKAEYENIRKRKQDERARQLQQKQEREAALNKYKQKKKIKNKKLSAKTAKGQPVMRTRIEMLLEKIQSST